MKVLKPLAAIVFLAIFASCNTTGRKNIQLTIEGTPTYSDSVLVDHHGHEDSLHHEAKDLKHKEYRR